MSQQELEAYIAEQERDDFAVGSAKTFALGMGLASLVALAVRLGADCWLRWLS